MEDKEGMKPVGQSVPRKVGSLSNLPELTPASRLKSTPDFAAERAELLFSYYRKDEVANARMFFTGIVAVFTDYSPDVVRYITDPRTGLQRRIKFLPSIAEIVEACDERVVEIAKQEEGKRWKARKVAEPQPMPPRPEGTDYFSMFAKYGRPIGRFEKVDPPRLTGGLAGAPKP